MFIICLDNGVYVNLADGCTWDAEVVGSNPATPTSGLEERLLVRFMP